MDATVTTRKNPQVSVIMPAYNCEKFIEASVRSVMAQTVTDWELLILDDGSSDATWTIVEALAREDNRIRPVKNPQNMGVAKTRNHGIDLSKGAFIAFLDSDDIWHPDKLEKQLQRMEETGADFSYTSYAIVDAEGNRSKNDYLVPEKVTFETLLKENVLGCSTVMLRSSTLENHRFRTDFYHEDYVLWLSLLQAGFKAAGCTQVLTDWRLIIHSRSFNKIKAAKNRWHIYTDYLHLPLHKKLWVFAGYAAASLRKYR